MAKQSIRCKNIVHKPHKSSDPCACDAVISYDDEATFQEGDIQANHPIRCPVCKCLFAHEAMVAPERLIPKHAKNATVVRPEVLSMESGAEGES